MKQTKLSRVRRVLMTLVVLLQGALTATASQTAVAHWEFTTGYDVVKTGSTAVYTPNNLGWSALANTAWKTTQPYFLPNTCALVPEDCRVTVHTSLYLRLALEHLRRCQLRPESRQQGAAHHPYADTVGHQLRQLQRHQCRR